MKDLRVVTAKVALKTISISPLRGFLPQSVLVVGEKLNQADEILYNGVQADEFVIASSTRLIVKVPTSQIGKPFTDLKVLAPVSVAKADAVLSLGLTRPLKTVSGIDRLVQSWLLVFLTTPGSDVFAPNSGGGGAAIIGRSTDRTGKNVAADLALAIEKTKQEIMRTQAENQTIPPSEKLLASSLDSVAFDEKTTVLSARVSIQNMIGDVAEVSLG
jgi:hypothetical protein